MGNKNIIRVGTKELRDTLDSGRQEKSGGKQHRGRQAGKGEEEDPGIGGEMFME